MKAEKTKQQNDTSTEEKIKNAARIVFHKKGFAATRTRDIAEEAGINLALLNYYFRSKQKLFDLIMLESLQEFIKSMTNIFNDENTQIEEKLETIVKKYIDLLITQPDLPLFILSELRSNPKELLAKMNVKNLLMNSTLIKQYKKAVSENKFQQENLLHFIMNFMGMMIFPFVAKPIFKALGEIDDEKFNELMNERKTLIPLWIKAITNKI